MAIIDGFTCTKFFLNIDMNPETVLNIGRQAIFITLLVSAPLLLVTLLIGLLVSIFQAATQINEASLSFIPKLLGLFATLLLAGSWILLTITDYFRYIFLEIPLLLS
jgi:flagellar biosynthetic protein FliQ